MIVHTVRLTGQKIRPAGKHIKIYVGCAASDIRYRDMLVFGRQRWEFYTVGTIEFTDTLEKADCAMIVVTENTADDQHVNKLITAILELRIPIVGVDMAKRQVVNIPKKLKGKMTKYGWEWFAEFIDQVAKNSGNII